MAELTTDEKIKGNGLEWNVRSGMYERTIDFGVAGLGSASYYEIGTFPKGFVPRNIAVVELEKANTASTVGVFKKGDSASVVSGNVGGADLGFTVAALDATAVGETLAVKLGAAFTSGSVKIVVSGDQMTGVWDESKRPVNPADAVPKNQL